MAQQSSSDVFSPQPGSKAMPPWTVGELPTSPVFRWSQLPLMLGPGLVMGAAAIGGGEWLTGPMVTARYGTGLLWLATFSVIFQVIYNVEISRYTLYSGEPIFTGKFRIAPHPMFWVLAYLVLDIGSILPYLAANAAIPLGALFTGRILDPKIDAEKQYLVILSCGIFMSVFLPLIFGGKVYNSMKVIMTTKLVVVIGFLLYLAFCFSSPATWYEISRGFFEVGNIPITPVEDLNKDGIQDANEDKHGPTVANIFTMPSSDWARFDLAMLGILASMAAISGNGGLTNTPISSYTRDQGWGMGKHVGAIPSLVGGHAIELSHTGTVFRITAESLVRWKGWIRHVQREQYLVWMPACFIGLGLPSMLSLVFLERGTVPTNRWQVAAMTADGVAKAFTGWQSSLFWGLTLFCGFLVMWTSLASLADGVLRRWVDVFWTSSPTLQRWDPKHIRTLYFGVLCCYFVFGLTMLIVVQKADQLLIAATGMMYNYALGVSCLHTLVVNTTLLPRELQPRLWQKIGLVCGSIFFIGLGVIVTLNDGPKILKDATQIFSSAPPAPKA